MTSSTTPNPAASNGGTTTQTAIEIPDYVTVVNPAEKRSIAELAAFAVGLLVEDLPQADVRQRLAVRAGDQSPIR